ncbi:hypothetical protein ACU4GD_36740 [Cupriavidus basilensis]
MKMETHIAAERDCEIAAVHVRPGDRVAAKDLLIEFKDISLTTRQGWPGGRPAMPLREALPRNTESRISPAMSQSRESAPPAAPSPSLRNAATLLVLRDGPLGIEVLMVRRAERAGDRSSGSYVYPGGTLDAQDRRLHAYADGLDDHAASQHLGVDAGGLDFYLAAVRECFEEAGLLFARDSAGQLLALDQLEEAQRALLRDAARHDGLGLAHACAQLGLRLAGRPSGVFQPLADATGIAQALRHPFLRGDRAHRPAPPRTMARRPPAIAGSVRRSFWTLPAVSSSEPPTRRTLAAIARFGRAQDCYQHAAALSGIARIMPRLRARRGRPARARSRRRQPCYAELGQYRSGGRGDRALHHRARRCGARRRAHLADHRPRWQ